MKILIICTHLNQGGISRYCCNLAEGLAKRGGEVIVASSGGEWVNQLERLGIRHKYIPIGTKSILSPKIVISLFILLPSIYKEKIQIIHANTRVTHFLGYLLWKISRTPYVSSFHGFYRPKFTRRLFKLSGLKTIAVSRAIEKHLVGDLKIKREKIKVVYNGINPEGFSEKVSKKSEAGLKEDDWAVGILGRVSEEKGHFLAVKALPLILSRCRNLYLFVSGRGRLEGKLKKFVKDKGLGARVKFVNCPADDFLNLVDLLIVPSRKEGFGFSVLEAFAKGVPVVGFNTGGIAEIIEDRKSGLLFYAYEEASLAETVSEAIKDNDLRAKVIEGAKERLRLFSLKQMAEGTEEVYQELR